MKLFLALMMLISGAADGMSGGREKLHEINSDNFRTLLLDRAFVEVNCTITTRCIEYFSNDGTYVQSGDLIPFVKGAFFLKGNQVCTKISNNDICRIFYFSQNNKKLYSTDIAGKNMRAYTYIKAYIPGYATGE